jgi:hypothetical protein
VRFRPDMTERWSCRAGDYILWGRCVDIFASGQDAFTINDYWELRDGDHVLLSNRASDLPDFVTNGQGQGPNIWRLQLGDRIAWVGPPRNRVHSEAAGPMVLGLVEAADPFVVYGESTRPRVHREGGLLFGEPSGGPANPAAVATARLGFDCIVNLGIPRAISID